MQDTELGGRILKVNHAGENGAIHIYAAQIFVARVTASSIVENLREFKLHEEKHRSIFLAELQRREKPRCRSYLLCGLGGYILGFVTALFGKNAIAATTVAVERVVLSHLKQQLQLLTDIDPAATAAITKIVDEEQQHHDESAAYASENSLWFRLLDPIVSTSTEVVIWIGMRS